MKSVKGKQWIKLICREPGSNFIITKNTKICSEHFVLGDFCSRSGRRYLKQNAVPSVFPWNQRQERLLSTSKKASQSLTFANDDVSSPNYDASTFNFDADLEPDNVELLVIAECFNFHRRSQQTGESAKYFAAELRRLTIHCNFGNHLDEALGDRFVCGLNTEMIQKQLLTEALREQ